MSESSFTVLHVFSLFAWLKIIYNIFKCFKSIVFRQTHFISALNVVGHVWFVAMTTCGSENIGLSVPLISFFLWCVFKVFLHVFSSCYIEHNFISQLQLVLRRKIDLKEVICFCKQKLNWCRLLFLSTGKVPKKSSLFTLDSKRLLDAHSSTPSPDPVFVPAFSLPETPDDPLVADMLKMCVGEGARFCKYDTLTTRSLAVGNSTLGAHRNFQALMDALQPGTTWKQGSVLSLVLVCLFFVSMCKREQNYCTWMFLVLSLIKYCLKMQKACAVKWFVRLAIKKLNEEVLKSYVFSP